MEISQVEDSGDQIPKEPAGKRRRKHWILQEHTGSHRIMEAVFQPENSGFFPVISDQFLAGKHRSDRNAPEKIQKFSGRNTASMIRCLPVYSYRNCPVFFDLGCDKEVQEDEDSIDASRNIIESELEENNECDPDESNGDCFHSFAGRTEEK